MENNVIKESYLEVLPNKELIETNKNILPITKIERKELLPVIIPKKELALIIIPTIVNNLKIHKAPIILKILKTLVKILAKIIRFCFIAIASIIGFIGVSVLIVMSTAIITKNIVNSYYGITPQEDTTYSIFHMKEETNQGIR